jgi:hypothetical protein
LKAGVIIEQTTFSRESAEGDSKKLRNWGVRSPLTDVTRSVFEISPLSDPRWPELVRNHPSSSVFHSLPWLRSLRETFKFEPSAITTSPSGDGLRNAILFCRAKSWLIGRRIVSLPFSDHCDVFLTDESAYKEFHRVIKEELKRGELAYFECRLTTPTPLTAAQPGSSNYNYWWHRLDLSPDAQNLFNSFHKSSTQRKIRKGEARLISREGRTPELLESFCNLLMRTRRRHSTLPQPKRWFESLIRNFGKDLNVRVAFKGSVAVAAVLTLQHRDTLVYKYACSDERYHSLGGMHLLIWHAILDAKRQNLALFDFGRTDRENEGLTTFKDRWGTERSLLTYTRIAAAESSPKPFVSPTSGWRKILPKIVLPVMPARALWSISDVVSKHLG